MSAFAPAAKQADVADVSNPVRLDFDLTLGSRTQQASAQPRLTIGARGRGAQTLQVQQTATPNTPQENQPEELTAQLPNEVQVPGFGQDAATESVAVLGNTAETTFGNNFNFDREQIQQFIDQQFGVAGPGGRGGDFNGQPGQGGPGGPEGQAGSAGQTRPRRLGGRGGGAANVVVALEEAAAAAAHAASHSVVAAGFGAPGLAVIFPIKLRIRIDAAPYSLPASNDEDLHTQNNFSASIGGPLVIPHVVKRQQPVHRHNGSRNRN